MRSARAAVLRLEGSIVVPLVILTSTSSENEISHGRVSWQGSLRSLHQGALASSVG